MSLSRDMTTRSRSPHVSPFESEPERSLHNLQAITVDSTPINEASFAKQFARTSLVNHLWRDELEVRPD